MTEPEPDITESRPLLDWGAVARVAKSPLPYSERDRSAIEAAAARYRQEAARERAEVGISFAELRSHATEVATAAKKLRTLLADRKARGLASRPNTALRQLQREATRAATSDTGGKGSNAYSIDLRENLLHLMAHRWNAAGREPKGATFYRVAAEVLRQLGVGGPIRSREMPARKVVDAILAEGGFDANVDTKLSSPNSM